MTALIFLAFLITFIIELFFYNFALNMRWEKGLKKFDENFKSIKTLKDFDYKLGITHLYK